MRIGVGIIIAAALGVILAAQAPPAQQPTFRTAVNFVRVDVYPSLNGRPVADLKKDEFEVFEDRVPQQVETFEHVVVRPAGGEAERGEPTTVRESLDAAGEARSRVFVLFLDVYHIRSLHAASAQRRQGTQIPPAFDNARRAASALSGFLERLIGPDDLVALMTPEMPMNALTFTRRPASIAEYLRSGEWERGIEFADLDSRDRMYAACYGMDSQTTVEMSSRRHERMVLSALRGLVEHLQGVREERKAILLVTEGWLLYTPSPVGGNNPTAPPRIGIDRGKPTIGDPRDAAPREECERDRQILSQIDDERELRELLQVANRANATFYPVDPSGLEAPATAAAWDLINRRQDPLRSLAAETDGAAIVNTNDINPGLKRVSDDLSSYYLLGYYSTNAKADGKFRAITVRVKRPGVTVRARPGYLAMSEAEAKAREAESASPPASNPDAAALQSALAVLDRGRADRVILLRGGYARSAGAQAAETVVPWVVVELDAAAARQPGWAQGGQVSASLVDPDGRGLGSGTARLSPTSRSTLIRFDHESVPPGDYFARVKAQWSVLMTTEQVRIAVPESSAQQPLAFGVPIVFRRGPFTGPAYQPTANPTFRRAERVRVDVPVSPRVQTVDARLLDRKGQALSMPVTAALRDEDRARLATAELSLAPLAAGDYVIELSLKADGRMEKVMTAIRIVP